MSLFNELSELGLEEGWDIKALKWISSHTSLLKQKFSKKFPRSPFLFVVQFKTKRGTLLVNNESTIRNKIKTSYLDLASLKRLGCPISK